MCGELRLEGEKIKFKNSVRSDLLTNNPHCHLNYDWTGFARVDGNLAGTKSMAGQWPASNWTITTLKAKGFVEKGTHFQFANSVQIGCIVSKSGELKIITRPARTESEKAVHHRMPSVVPENMSTEDYIDLIKRHAGYAK